MKDYKKQQILKSIEKNRDKLIEFLQEVVQIPSDNPPGDCLKIAENIAARLQEYGFDNISLLPVEEEKLKEVGMINVSNIVVYTNFDDGNGPEICLNAHGDVVAPGLGWTQDPYGGQIVDGKLYGRGAAVSKSDIATYTFALMALREIDHNLAGKVVLAFTFDEETGGDIGPKWLLENGHIHPNMAICAGFTYSIVNAHNGCLHMEITLKGKSAHAAAPHTGHDALEAMTALLQSLYNYRDTLNKVTSQVPGIDSPTLVVGLISGGTNTNVVPDKCSIRLDRRLIPEENIQQVEEEICQIAQGALKAFEGIEIDYKKILSANSFGPVSKDTPLIHSLSRNWKELMQKELSVHGVPLYTDARHFAEKGIPTVLFGAGPCTLLEANAHRADENVKVDDVIKATKIIAVTLYDLLTKE
jgi:succinyl-diaminopimelate desuccinylase